MFVLPKNQRRKCKSLHITSGPPSDICIQSIQQFLQRSTCAVGQYEMEIKSLICVQAGYTFLRQLSSGISHCQHQKPACVYL